MLSPSLLKKCSFEPTKMHQCFNIQLNVEFIFLLSDSKICILGRKDPPTSFDKNHPFTPYFICDFLDTLGMIRRVELFSEFCGVDDFKHVQKSQKENDPLRLMESDESQLIKNRSFPLNRH